jgi:hypothetical protein
MDAFSYLSVLLSIILGLAITQILKGVRGVVLARAIVVPYWPTFVLVAFLLVLDVQSWWSMFGMRLITTWTFSMFAVVLLQTVVLYMLAALVLPDFFGEKTVDLRAHYFGHRRIFYGLFLALLLVSFAKEFVLGGSPPETTNWAFHLCFAIVSMFGLLTAREWCHKLLVLVMPVLMLIYIGLLFARLH